jgi:hypothetical protein
LVAILNERRSPSHGSRESADPRAAMISRLFRFSSTLSAVWQGAERPHSTNLRSSRLALPRGPPLAAVLARPSRQGAERFFPARKPWEGRSTSSFRKIFETGIVTASLRRCEAEKRGMVPANCSRFLHCGRTARAFRSSSPSFRFGIAPAGYLASPRLCETSPRGSKS